MYEIRRFLLFFEVYKYQINIHVLSVMADNISTYHSSIDLVKKNRNNDVVWKNYFAILISKRIVCIIYNGNKFYAFITHNEEFFTCLDIVNY